MFRTVAALIALIAVLTAPASAALGDTFKICMHSSGSPSCAGDEIALGFDDFVSQFGANLGAPEQQEAIAHRFCKIDGADGKTTMELRGRDTHCPIFRFSL
jgi:hypothetical protein